MFAKPVDGSDSILAFISKLPHILAAESLRKLIRSIVEGLPGGTAYPHQDISILAAAYKKRIPVSVHVAIGTDIIHAHPSASGKAIGEASQHDFRLFCASVRDLDGGGVYLNVGSA